MPLIVIRLFPAGGAVSGDSFRTYLDDLQIRAVDLATDGTEVQIGDPATYTEPPDLTHPELPDPATLIVQHSVLIDVITGEFAFQAAATAVIAVAAPNPPAGHPEHGTRDIRLEITRGGSTVLQRRLYMNVPEVDLPAVPAVRSIFPSLEPTGIFFALPDPGQQLDPADAYVELPVDGTPPPYADVLNAIARVLGGDPGGPLDLQSLTVAQARHVAREIVWNQKFRPLPGPPGVLLGSYFTDPVDEDLESESGIFAGELTAYEAVGDADADRLAGYIVALSAAVVAEATSTATTVVGLTFPVLPGQSGTGERYQNARVLLTALPAAVRFTVPARYFYALGAALPLDYDASQRYRSAILADEERIRTELTSALDRQVIDLTPPPVPVGLPAGAPPVADAPAVNIEQAVRRLHALGDVAGGPAELPVAGDVQTLVAAWLLVAAADIDVAFWDGIVASQPSGHLDLDLAAVTRGYVVTTDGEPLRVKLRARLPVVNAPQLAAQTEDDWRTAMTGDATWPQNLPNWTLPGSEDERLQALIQEVAKFFALTLTVPPSPADEALAPPVIRIPSADPLNRFVQAYLARAGVPFIFGQAFVEADRAGAVDDVVAAVYGADPKARSWLDGVITTIDELVHLVSAVPAALQFSVIESLYARGFTRSADVAALTPRRFRDALVGTVACDLADDIHDEAVGPGPTPGPEVGGFQPVNPDGCLVECIPPAHLSPTGPFAYLKALLDLTIESGCDGPVVPGTSLSALVSARRGPLAELAVTAANLQTPLPVVDLVVESLEAMASIPGSATGAVHDTAGGEVGGGEVGGHRLAPAPGGHDPATLLAALPEHSSPSVPVAAPDAYEALRTDVSHPLLPYAQGVDVNRSYLRTLGTCRFDVLRGFRRDITEFVLDPAGEPAGFRRAVRRYPVRHDIALEYLCLTPEEYDAFFARDLKAEPRDGEIPVWRVYGFAGALDGRLQWTVTAARVPEFLERTGVSWCEFVDLWRSRIVPFGRLVPAKGDDGNDGDNGGGEGEPAGFPDCEPCDIHDYVLSFSGEGSVADGLRRLAVVSRLWRAVSRCAPALTMAEFADVCEVIGLFGADGSVNPDAVRQIAAFQMLRSDFGVPLRPPRAPAEGSGTARTPLLALWAGPADASWPWAVDTLLEHVRRRAMRHLRSRPRPAEFLEVLRANLTRLSLLAGFDPDTPAATWHARPTHTLRFAEVLSKLYTSDVGVGDLVFLATTDDHLQGDDPFPLQPPNEADDDPLALPDDDQPASLWALRRTLLEAEASADGWTWSQVETAVRAELGYQPAGSDPLYILGARFFPTVLERDGLTVPAADRRWQVPLPGSPAGMWNTPPAGPFRYLGDQLSLVLPVRPGDVIAKLARIRQLNPAEQGAVRDLLAGPGAAVNALAYLFSDPDEAVRVLTAEPEEQARFEYVAGQVALAVARVRRIAEHLAAHVVAVTGQPGEDVADLAHALLLRQHADENPALGPWEDDAGLAPGKRWPVPAGGALAALLSLVGTGLLGEFGPPAGKPGTPVWRELRGPMSAFGPAQNQACAPLPGLLPALGSAIAADQSRFVAVRNGFAITNPGGEVLGGVQGFAVRWTGALLIEEGGRYTFGIGAPAGEPGESEAESEAEAGWPSRRGGHAAGWRVVLRRGQRVWVLLERRWPGGAGAPDWRSALDLRRGAYDLEIQYEQPAPDLAEPDDVRALVAGIELAYSGPDTGGDPAVVPRHRLYRPIQDPVRLDAGIEGLTAVEGEALAARYTGSLRDARRTYQRAFKSLLLAHRLHLSAAPQADDGESEIGYLLRSGALFAGAAYFRDGGPWAVHLADLDPDLLPVHDTYRPPAAADQRLAPSVRRRQAIVDWWERLFDYTMLRRDAGGAPERPVWLLFHESAEEHPDLPADLLRHLGVDLRRTDLVCRYEPGTRLESGDLRDEQWPVRVWHADTLLRQVLRCFLVADIRSARPDRWAAADPGAPLDDTSGNANLVRVVRDGLIENGAPRRYADLAALDDCLRERARAALLAHLCRLNRVPLPWGGAARTPKDLSDLLLQDVEAGAAERASRVDEAIAALQTFVTRARLGLEPGIQLSADFVRLWEARFARYRLWELCVRRGLYRENVVDLDVVAEARRTEAFRFLEERLRQVTLTRPVPGGLDVWDAAPAPEHPGITALQVRQPSTLRPVDPAGHGFDLMGTPERGGRPSWLAALALADRNDGDDGDGDGDGDGGDGDGGDGDGDGGDGDGDGGDGGGGDGGGGDGPGEIPAVVAGDAVAERDEAPGRQLPWWVSAAVRLGTRFLRVAAAGDPPACADPVHLLGGPPASSCCGGCGDHHDATGGPLLTEYYFWLVDARWFDAAPAQDTGWAWHDPLALPELLSWSSGPLVRLAWCRVHAGDLGPVEYSTEGVRVAGMPRLTFSGRIDDSLTFEVLGGTAPDGYPVPPPPGFRFDLANQAAVVLPRAVAPPPVLPPAGPLHPGRLPAYPYFVYHRAGAPLYPDDPHAVAVIMGSVVRSRCRPEAALGWYGLVTDPPHHDSSWLRCTPSKRLRACCDDSTIATEDEVRRRSVLLHYLESLVEVVDGLLRHRPSPEADAQARVVLDTAATVLGPRPRTVLAQANGAFSVPVRAFVPHPAPPNPRLLSLYDQVADRLALVRSRQTAQRLPMGRYSTDVPHFGHSGLADGWREADGVRDPCADDGSCVPCSPYRFSVLIGRAKELAGQVRGLGAAVLGAIEKGDAEQVMAVRLRHERQLNESALVAGQLQWRDADWQVRALEKTKQIALTNRRYYADLVEAGLTRGENDHLANTDVAIGSYVTSIPLEAAGQAIGFIPDIWLGVAGLGPLNANQLPLGTKLAGVFATGARIAGTVGQIAAATAGKRLTEAGWDRRAEDWRHQVEILDIEIEQIERLILGAERRRDAALHQLGEQQLRIEQSREIDALVREKLTGQALYLWLHNELVALYWQGYEIAVRVAHQALRAFELERASDLERGRSATDALTGPLWDHRHEGLLAGERLEGALRDLEQRYLDCNEREYELVKHVSVRLTDPLAFLRLQASGACEIELPEWLFDQDHPGQYMRRIKSVSLSIPAVVGPYSGVHARLTLLSSTTRVRPELVRPPAGCCGTDGSDSGDSDSGDCGCGHGCGCGCSGCCCGCPVPEADEGDGYALRPDDRRAVRDFASLAAIATSTGQNDSGMFEVNFRDDRYLHFEYAGAVSRWLLELPQDTNRFDVSSVSDVIMHLSYTAREGGEALRRAARRQSRDRLPGDGLRVFDVEHDLPEAWHALRAGTPDAKRELELRLWRGMFPWLPDPGGVRLHALELFIEAPCAEPSRHHPVRFRPVRRHRAPGRDGREPVLSRERFDDVECVASADWPDLFHGVVPGIDAVAPAGRPEGSIGSITLPPSLGPVERIWLLCGYSAEPCAARGDRSAEG